MVPFDFAQGRLAHHERCAVGLDSGLRRNDGGKNLLTMNTGARLRSSPRRRPGSRFFDSAYFTALREAWSARVAKSDFSPSEDAVAWIPACAAMSAPGTAYCLLRITQYSNCGRDLIRCAAGALE
jgi:hypothetical protein